MRFKLAFLTSLFAVAAAATVWSGSILWREYQAKPTLKPTVEDARQEKERIARQKTAFESLEMRIPKGKPIPLPRPFSQGAAERWENMARDIEVANTYRASALKALHEKTRRFFVESPGFGLERMERRPIMTDEYLLFLAENSPPLQPGYPPTFGTFAEEPALRSVEPEKDDYWYHFDSVLQFVYPGSFGYVKDRKNVAGFQSHGFRNTWIPVNTSKPWKVDHILLIGILVQDKPVVYLSDNLPSMKLANKSITRPLDPIEERGLNALKDGEDLFVVQQRDALRMVGALRSTKQCLQCHDGAQGDLLGAFSYTLRRKETPSPK